MYMFLSGLTTRSVIMSRSAIEIVQDIARDHVEERRRSRVVTFHTEK